MKTVLLFTVGLSMFSLSFKEIPDIYNVTQNKSNAIDSIFNFYFQVLELEINDSINITTHPDFYHCFYDSLSNDSLCMNKYILETISFMENITNIQAEHSMEVQASYLTKDTIKKWKEWFRTNKSMLVWETSCQRVNRRDVNIYTSRCKSKYRRR